MVRPCYFPIIHPYCSSKVAGNWSVMINKSDMPIDIFAISSWRGTSTRGVQGATDMHGSSHHNRSRMYRRPSKQRPNTTFVLDFSDGRIGSYRRARTSRLAVVPDALLPPLDSFRYDPNACECTVTRKLIMQFIKEATWGVLLLPSSRGDQLYKRILFGEKTEKQRKGAQLEG